ncbi:hypothetical protein OAB57_00540 [Bacteriovoracaceae bacterium]|nr:hypothetical protein [Bacteriovoracaceae bacterium]
MFANLMKIRNLSIVFAIYLQMTSITLASDLRYRSSTGEQLTTSPEVEQVTRERKKNGPHKFKILGSALLGFAVLGYLNSFSMIRNEPKLRGNIVDWTPGCKTPDYDMTGWQCGKSGYCYGSPEYQLCDDVKKYLNENEPSVNKYCMCPKVKVDSSHKTNIIMVHNGGQEYACRSIQQILKYADPDLFRFTWIGESGHCPNIERLDPEKLVDKGIQKFRKQYVHKGPNDPKYEQFCFERWMLANNLVKSKYKNDPVILIDSDLLIFKNISKILDSLSDFKIATTIPKIRDNMPLPVFPHFTYFPNPMELDDLVNYMYNIYDQQSEAREEDLKRIGIQLEGEDSPFLVSDMYVAGDYIKKHYPENNGPDIASFGKPLKDGSLIVYNMGVQVNKLVVKDGKISAPSITSVKHKFENIEIAGIHFQGMTKEFEVPLLNVIEKSQDGVRYECNLDSDQQSQNSFDCFENKRKHRIDYVPNADIPNKIKNQIDLGKFSVVHIEGRNKANGYLASGGYGDIYLVEERLTGEIWAAKFIRDDVSKERKAEAERVALYEHKLPKVWEESVGNPLKGKKIGSVFYKTYYPGNLLHDWVKSQELFSNTKKSETARNSLIKLFKKLIAKSILIADLQANNLIYDESNEQWVIIDGDGIINFDSPLEAKKAFLKTAKAMITYKVKLQDKNEMNDIFKKVEALLNNI